MFFHRALYQLSDERFVDFARHRNVSRALERFDRPKRVPRRDPVDAVECEPIVLEQSLHRRYARLVLGIIARLGEGGGPAFSRLRANAQEIGRIVAAQGALLVPFDFEVVIECAELRVTGKIFDASRMGVDGTGEDIVVPFVDVALERGRALARQDAQPASAYPSAFGLEGDGAIEHIARLVAEAIIGMRGRRKREPGCKDGSGYLQTAQHLCYGRSPQGYGATITS